MTHPSSDALLRLEGIVRALRDPETGCPWDLKQDHRSMATYLLEEAHEVIEALDQADDEAFCEELGDLFFVLVFQAHLASQRGAFSLGDALTRVSDKMVERHPHVFGEDRRLETAQEVLEAWEARKRRQKQRGVLDGIPLSLPALHRAWQITARAATVGFDWDHVSHVVHKIEEEVQELKEALAAGELGHIEEELGDTLFALVNLARHLDIDAERALRGTNRKFERRFAYIEAQLQARGSSPQSSNLEEMDALWNEAKKLT